MHARRVRGQGRKALKLMRRDVMRSTGILRSWHDERGFGFIAPTRGGAELFVHVSALPRDGSRPVVGETLSFELGRGKDGRPQAVNVIRSVVGADARPARERRRQGASAPPWLWRGLLLVVVVAAVSWGFSAYRERAQRPHLDRQPAETPGPESLQTGAREGQFGSSPVYRCDGRTKCSQMTSCAEATWFIKHCPGTQMDGNHDGVPCEQQWCTAADVR